MFQIERAYEPSARSDGPRILVERLWPRGLKKEALAADAWMKDVAPSPALRVWFGHRPERWEEFRRRYEQELSPLRTAPLEARGVRCALAEPMARDEHRQSLRRSRHGIAPDDVAMAAFHLSRYVLTKDGET
jgi:uncharacterized protein YeaO (DUF488 family)